MSLSPSPLRLLLSLMLWLALPCAGFAQTAQYETLTIEQGLSQGMIFDILQTRDGFLWVATKDGLNRYDGYNFKVFSNNPFDSTSISGNTVTALFEDSRGWLWLGIQDEGVDVYDPKTGRFRHFPFSFDENKSPWGGTIESILESPSGGSVWALSRHGAVLHFAMPTAWPNSLPDAKQLPPPSIIYMPPPISPIFPGHLESFQSLQHSPNGDILVFSQKMVRSIDPKTGTIKQLPQLSTETLMLSCIRVEHQREDVIWSIRVAPESEAGGADLMRFRGGQASVFAIPRHMDLWWKHLSPGKDNHIWMGIGPHAWDLAPDETPDFTKPDLTFDYPTNQIMSDRRGNVWAATSGFGLRKVTPLQGHFHAGAAGVSLGGVWAWGSRYFARYLGEICAFDPLTGKFAERTAFPDAPANQSNLAFEPSGGLWLLCVTRDAARKSMLLHYPPGGGSADQRFSFDARLSNFDPMFRAPDGRLWIATADGQLLCFNPREVGAGSATASSEFFKFSQLFGEAAKNITCVAIAGEENGRIWIGTQTGLVKATPSAQGFDFQLLKADPKTPAGLNNSSIACILPAPDGQIWLGTKGGGINILNPETGTCRHITTADGLLNNVVYGILPGNRADEFWCSTNRGLAKICLPPPPSKGGGVAGPLPFGEGWGGAVITTFTASVGLQDNEFNTRAYWKSDRGELLFGGINGLNRFFPDELHSDTTPPPVYIVGLEINRKKANFGDPGSPLAVPLEMTRRIELAFDQNNLSFEFAALDFTDPSKNRYRYRLVGLENDWVEAGQGRFAHYTHLPPGRYELRVQGSNGESAWRDATPIVIVVRPPWWRSNLAYLCYLALLAWAGWRAYRFQIQRIKDREQLAFEHRETERVKAMEQVKTNFFSNVTHEFRTPLTLIIEPLRQILTETHEPKTRDKAQLAERNSRQLLGLVNQLLDMAKLESGQMALDLRHGNLGQTVREVFERFLPLAEKRGVKLVLAAPPTALPEFDFDPGKVELVLNNLISNALKFTPQGGRVELRIENLELRNTPPSILNSPFSIPASILHSTFYIQVKDSGIGIPAESMGKIFDRFYQVDGSNTRTGEGTGIGLALSKELAELMGGGIRAESVVGKGSTFTFWIPVAGSAGVTQSHPDTGDSAPDFGNLSNSRNLTLGSRSGEAAEKPVALVVEDNPELRQFIKKSIAGAGWQVIEASDGEEGVRKAIELLPDLIISDLMMPRKDGFAVCHELKNHELTAHIPIILLTAKAAIESKLKGLRTGADDYLTKPFNTEELLVRMENLVETRRRLRERFAQMSASQATGTAEPLPEFLSAPDQAFLRKINLLIEQHLDDEAVTVEDFAAKMFVSRMQLHRKLTALAGQSATAYVRNYRLDRAMAMLKNREGNVFQVSGMVGFGNEKYFSTVFKERFGVSPSDV